MMGYNGIHLTEVWREIYIYPQNHNGQLNKKKSE